MDKKREMVNTVLDRLSAANVSYSSENDVLSSVSLRAPKGFWERCPDGHCNPTMDQYIEGELSCLDEESLGRILSADLIQKGMTYYDLWRAWGYAGYFKTKPSIIYTGGDRIPILRMRHDCYLHWFRGLGFQNSYDGYCNGSNGSDLGARVAARAVKCPLSIYPDDWDDNTDEEALEDAWRTEWALFRKAMFLAYIFRAGGSKQALWNTVWNHGDVFDQFVTKTDEVTDIFHLDPTLTVADMRATCLGTTLDTSFLFEVPVLVKPVAGSYRAVALLQFARTGVQLQFSSNDQRHTAAIEFPEWNRDDWEGEAVTLDLGCEKPETLCEVAYYNTCWFDLATTLFGLCGLSCGYGPVFLQRGVTLDCVKPVFWDKEQCVTGGDALYSVIFKHTAGFLGLENLIADMTAGVV